MAEDQGTTTTDGLRRPVLTLERLADRPVVEIYGVQYEMLRPDEISPFTMARWARAGQELTRAVTEQPDAVDEATEARLREALRAGTAAAIPGLPPDVLDRMPLQHHLAVLNAFLEQTLRFAAARAGTTGSPPTSPSISPGSSGSTAARRPRGSTRRRGSSKPAPG